MKYLKAVPKQDLIRLLEIINDIRSVADTDQFEHCLSRMKALMLFDGALCVYCDKQALDDRQTPGFYYSTLDFADQFLEQYVEGRYYEKSAVFQTLYKTWHPQHWQTAWSRGMDANGVCAMRLARSFGYLDGWACASYHPGNSTLSVLAFAGREVETDVRTKAIIKYITPHLAESLKQVYHPDLNQDRQCRQLRLTARELEVLKWIEEGKSTWDVSMILERSERVIKYHVNNLMQKLCALNRTHAVAIAHRYGILS